MVANAFLAVMVAFVLATGALVTFSSLWFDDAR